MVHRTPRQGGSNSGSSLCIDEHVVIILLHCMHSDEEQNVFIMFCPISCRVQTRRCYLPGIICLRTFFWTFPVDVFGSSCRNTTCLGTWKWAILLRAHAITSFSVSCPATSLVCRTMKAHGTSPHFSSGLATKAISLMAGCIKIMFSTSMEEMFSPPDMMMSASINRSLVRPL